MQETSEGERPAVRPADARAFRWRMAWLMTTSAAAALALLTSLCPSLPMLAWVAWLLAGAGAVLLIIWICRVWRQP